MGALAAETGGLPDIPNVRRGPVEIMGMDWTYYGVGEFMLIKGSIAADLRNSRIGCFTMVV